MVPKICLQLNISVGGIAHGFRVTGKRQIRIPAFSTTVAAATNLISTVFHSAIHDSQGLSSFCCCSRFLSRAFFILPYNCEFWLYNAALALPDSIPPSGDTSRRWIHFVGHNWNRPKYYPKSWYSNIYLIYSAIRIHVCPIMMLKNNLTFLEKNLCPTYRISLRITLRTN